MIDTETLQQTLERQIRQAVDQSVQVHLENIIEQLALDPVWVAKIESMVNQSYAKKFTNKLNTVDVESLIVENIDAGIERWQSRLKKDFQTNGIIDGATSIQLTVLDDAIVAQNGLAAQSLLIEKDAQIQGCLVVHDLAVRGSINTDNRSWQELANGVAAATLTKLTDDWRKSLVDDVLTLAKTNGINFDTVMINDSPLIDNDILNSSVTKSNLQSVGILDSLEVSGTARLNKTLTVNRSRVGINTDSPEMALSVWDEEVSLLGGKISKNIAYVGTGRNQNLNLGVNRNSYLEINTDGLTTVKKLRIDRFCISHGTQSPGHDGTRGDMVFNSDPKPDTPFAWVCLGGLRWQGLWSAK